MDTLAVVFEGAERLALRRLELNDPGPADVVVEVDWSGVSTGTERLLWSGRMPPFPGFGYPLVPGYESVGTVVEAGVEARVLLGKRVFAPGSAGFRDVRGLFGGAARRLVLPAARTVPAPEALGEQGALLALAATARHALSGGTPPELIVGHGVLGRLLARLAVLEGASPVVWETQAARREGGGAGYRVIDPGEDARRDYAAICDASGDAALLDALVARLARGGRLVLAGFYDKPLSFAFPPAFMRELRLQVAAEWTPDDMEAVAAQIVAGSLSLDDLVTHRVPASDAEAAYRTAFTDPACLKLLLDWRTGG